MDFLATLSRVTAFLDERNVSWALVGGLALSAYGGTRTTLDLDLAVDGSVQDDLIRFMESEGFDTLYRSPGYSNHLHPNADLGRVDFVYVRGQTRKKLFGEAREQPGPEGRPVLVARPEHLIAMKVIAMKNDPGRTFQDLADIRVLMQQPGIDRDEIRRFFARHGLLERFDELEETL